MLKIYSKARILSEGLSCKIMCSRMHKKGGEHETEGKRKSDPRAARGSHNLRTFFTFSSSIVKEEEEEEKQR